MYATGIRITLNHCCRNVIAALEKEIRRCKMQSKGLTPEDTYGRSAAWKTPDVWLSNNVNCQTASISQQHVRTLPNFTISCFVSTPLHQESPSQNYIHIPTDSGRLTFPSKFDCFLLASLRKYRQSFNVWRPGFSRGTTTSLPSKSN